MVTFLYAEYAAAAVLVTFCVVLGKVSILQLVIMALIEVYSPMRQFLNLSKCSGDSLHD